MLIQSCRATENLTKTYQLAWWFGSHTFVKLIIDSHTEAHTHIRTHARTHARTRALT